MSNPKAPKDKDAGRKHFSTKEYKLLCEWLEVEENLESILCTEGKTKAGNRYHTKKLAFEAMAQYINDRQYKGSDLAKLDFQGAKNRFNHLNVKYKKAKQMSEAAGFGVTEFDEADGIRSIAAKLEKLCPCFDRLDCIFGNKPKVDTQGNLILSQLMDEEGDCPTPDAFLTQHDGTHNSPPVKENDLPDVMEVCNPELAHVSPEVAMPTTPVESITPAESTDRPRAQTPPLERQAPNCQDSSPQSEGGTLPESSEKSYLRKLKKGSASHTKKRSIEKNAGLTGTFTRSMGMLSEGKLRSLEMKEKVMVQRAQTAAIRAETAQQQLTFMQQQLSFEAQRLRLEEKKLEQDAAAKEAERIEGKRARKVQARIDIINSNNHRPPHELAEIIAMVENVE